MRCYNVSHNDSRVKPQQHHGDWCVFFLSVRVSVYQAKNRPLTPLSSSVEGSAPAAPGAHIPRGHRSVTGDDTIREGTVIPE